VDFSEIREDWDMCSLANLFAIVGLVILVTGKVKVTHARVVRGMPAYCIGCLFVAPAIIALVGAPELAAYVGLAAVIVAVIYVLFAKGGPPEQAD